MFSGTVCSMKQKLSIMEKAKAFVWCQEVLRSLMAFYSIKKFG